MPGELLAPIDLLPEAAATLADIKQHTEPTRLEGVHPRTAERCLVQITEPMLMAAGLPLTRIDQYRWYVRELSRLFRTRSGPELEFRIELVLRKWTGLKLEQRTMQLLLCEVWKRVRTMEQPDTEALPLPGSPSAPHATDAMPVDIADTS